MRVISGKKLNIVGIKLRLYFEMEKNEVSGPKRKSTDSSYRN